jgi:hypothetical protein
MGQGELLKLVKQQLIVFIDELIDVIPEQDDLHVVKLIVREQLLDSEIMEFLVSKILPLEDLIRKRDCENLCRSIQMFSPKVSKYIIIWETADEENRNIVWEWLNHFMELAKKYKKIV